MTDVSVLEKKQFIRVNFTNRGFAKVIKGSNSLSDDTPDKFNILHISNLLSDAKIKKDEPILFKTIPEMLGVDYVGYIIEKERLEKKTGEWVRIDEYRIIGAEANNFTDTRVAYGESYRYRIKSILKLSKAKIKKGLSHLEFIEDVKKFEEEKIKTSLEKNKPILENLNKLLNLGLKSKVSKGQESKEIKLSDQISLKATSTSTDIIKKKPSIFENLRLLKNLRVEDPNLPTGKVQDVDFQKIINKNIAKFKEQKIDYFSCYFESNPSKNWVYVDAVENVPPPPPNTIKITPCTSKREIIISWLPPANPQRDIKFFKIYRRNIVGQPWKLLTTAGDTLDVNQDGIIDDPEREEEAKLPRFLNLYIDKRVLVGVKYIYALSSVDVHGIESFLSTQIQAELNPNYIIEKEEKPLRWISGSGTKPEEINFILKKFLNRTEQIIAKRNIVLSPNTKFSEAQKDLVIRVTSLDTHESREFKVVIKNNNIKQIQ